MTIQDDISAITALDQRGLKGQCTNEVALDAHVRDGEAAAYVGFDLTARSLHVGHLVSLAALRRIARLGVRPIVLLGGATSLVGDPSFRKDRRPMLTAIEIKTNRNGIESCIRRVLGPEVGAEFVDNSDWLSGIGLLEFMRNVGSHFPVSQMLAADSVRSRLQDGGGLTALEFTYSMLQAHDFTELGRTRGCRIQIGGSDQWGNICAGVDLGRRTGLPELFGLTVPLLETADGRKMGKTADGAVWLDPEMTSPADFRHFWRNVDDRDVVRFLRMLTDVPIDRIERLATLHGSAINEAKELLADEVTALVHGAGAVALEGSADAIDATSARGLPDVLKLAGLAGSVSAAMRLIEQGAVRVDGDRMGNVELPAAGTRVITVGRRPGVLVSL